MSCSWSWRSRREYGPLAGQPPWSESKQWKSIKLFGRRLAWGTKLWFAAWLLAFPIMLVGELAHARWLWFAYGAVLVLVVLPLLNIIEGVSRARGGKSIMWEEG